MWNFHDFTITQILREINFGDSRSAKCAILTCSETLNFDFYEILQFTEAEIHLINKVQSPEIAKTVFLELLDSLKWFHVKSEW